MQHHEDRVIRVDASLFTADQSVGHVTGSLKVRSLPAEGSVMPFVHDNSDNAASLLGDLTVEHVLTPEQEGDEWLFALSDIVVKTKSEAFQVAKYLERHFGFYADIHGDDDFLEYQSLSG